MSAPQHGDRAAHLAAFALLVADGLIAKRTATNALLRRDYFTHPADTENAKEPPGYKTARGHAWLVDEGTLTYSEATYLVARAIQAKTRVDIDYAMLRADRLIARTLTEIDNHRTKAGRELGEVIKQLGTRQAANQTNQPAPASVTPIRRQVGPT